MHIDQLLKQADASMYKDKKIKYTARQPEFIE